jgi:hypothetical protein
VSTIRKGGIILDPCVDVIAVFEAHHVPPHVVEKITWENVFDERVPEWLIADDGTFDSGERMITAAQKIRSRLSRPDAVYAQLITCCGYSHTIILHQEEGTILARRQCKPKRSRWGKRACGSDWFKRATLWKTPSNRQFVEAVKKIQFNFAHVRGNWVPVDVLEVMHIVDWHQISK